MLNGKIDAYNCVTIANASMTMNLKTLRQKSLTFIANEKKSGNNITIKDLNTELKAELCDMFF